MGSTPGGRSCRPATTKAIVLLTMHTEEHHVAAGAARRHSGVPAEDPGRRGSGARDPRRPARSASSSAPPSRESLSTAIFPGTQAPDDPLAPRERQVLQLVAEGKTSKEIAADAWTSASRRPSPTARISWKSWTSTKRPGSFATPSGGAWCSPSGFLPPATGIFPTTAPEIAG